MSINAEFVAVSPDELEGFAADPESAIESLFMPPLGGTAGLHRTLSLDKAWHGVHYLLTGEPEESTGAVLGGTEFGEDEGYGPARYFTAPEVEQLVHALDAPGAADEAAARYDGDRMLELSIYPGGWDEDEEREWLLGALDELRSFFRDTAAAGDAIVTCLV
jgi:hypothetical protein